MSLAQRSATAAGWTMAANLLKAGLQFVQLVVLTRLLLPQDYGLIALVMVIISYAGLFSDMGLSSAFIQRQQISQEERSSLYWLSVLVGAALMLVVMLMSPLAAHFYENPALMPLLMLTSISFVLVAIGQQLRMDAEKRLHFKPVALIEISAAFAGFAVALITAWFEWGVYALVAGALSSSLITSVLNWIFLSKGWRPMWRLKWNEVRWFVCFGAGMVANNIINHVNATVDLLLGGKLLGVSQLGLYSVPRSLVLQVQLMVNPIFTRVGFPVIASIQNDKVRVQKVYLKIMNLTASVNAPIYLAIFAFAPELVQLVLGSRFGDAEPLLRVMALWGLLRSFGNPVGSLLFGLGMVRLSTLWNASLLLVVPPALWWGARFGTLGMAWAMVAVMGLLFVPAWALLVRPSCGLGLLPYARQVVMPSVSATLAAGLAWMAVTALETPLMRLLGGFTVGLFSYILICFLLNRMWLQMLVGLIGRVKAVDKNR